MAERRRYTKRTRVTTVMAAEMTSIPAAAESSGIPENTIRYWMDTPEMVELRAKTREDLADESKALAHKALGEIQRRLGEFEPRDLTVLYGVLTDKSQLLSGHATGRTEHRDLTGGLEDHEKEALRALLDDVLKVPA
jgi:hypothetical protein